MVAKKPRIVIIGAGMAGITAANKLHTSVPARNEMFDLFVVEGAKRIGGRINSSDFARDRIEMGATWIHGIDGSPVHRIAGEIGSLNSDRPWEWMDGFVQDGRRTVAEGGFEINPSLVDSVSTLFNNLMDYARGELTKSVAAEGLDFFYRLPKRSVGSFLREGLNRYWNSLENQDEVVLLGEGRFSKRSMEEAIFAMLENCQRNDTSASDLETLDFNAESEYRMFPGEEITIAKGYSSVIESLASVLPPGVIQLDRKVRQIQWQAAGNGNSSSTARPVKLHFSDGSTMSADHVIITVSLGVLKAGIGPSWSLFNPPLPFFKTDAISRLGYGVVNKLFLELSNEGSNSVPNNKFPFLEMAFHRPNSEHRVKEIPWWIRRTASLTPIHNKSNVLLSWFTGKEALELESLSDEEIINGVSATISGFLPNTDNNRVKFSKVLRSKWGNDPLFLGSYSYVAVGSSGDDLDAMAQPLPSSSEECEDEGCKVPSPLLQILFAGEATHRTHYSTTHGAYFSGIREANRLLQHYQWVKKGLDDY
ncbi:Probable polyamine oxidase 5 [Linum grandiflorum]